MAIYDMRRTPEARALAEASAGVLCLDDCRALGIPDETAYWLVESGRWQSPFPRVFVVFSGPLPRVTLEEAALAYAGDDAALALFSSGAYWGLCPVPGGVHIVVSYERKVRRQPLLVVHRSRVLRPEDIHPTRRPRRLRIEPTVVGMLGSCRNATAALALVSNAVRSRHTTARRLGLAIAERRTVRWRGEVLAAMPDVAAGALSVLELMDARLRRAHGLPLGERQIRRDVDGVEYLDVLIREFRLHIELDGRLGHEGARARARDRRRDNTSEVEHLRHMRYGFADLYDRGCEAMMEQTVVLRQQGWGEPFRRCPRCPRILPPEV